MEIKMNRREFVASAAVGAASVALGSTAWAQEAGTPTSRPVDPFAQVALGKSGLNTTFLGIGLGSHGGNRSSNQKRLGEAKFDELANAAWDAGIRLFDVADIYGTNTDLARALKGKPREKYTIVSKIWPHAGTLPEKERPDANVVVDRFRKELNTDYIDLVQLHCMTSPKWTDEQKRQMEILEDLKAKGIIRAHGASIHSLVALEACVESSWVDVVHARINAFGDAMDDKPEKVAPVLARVSAAGKGIIGMKLVGDGKYRNQPDKIDASLKYAIGLGSISAIIAGFEDPKQIADFAARVRKAM